MRLPLVAAVVLVSVPLTAADPVRTVETADWKVELSPPVLVARSRGHLWFPTVMVPSEGNLLAMLNDYADEVVHRPTAVVCWSRDGGRTWSEPVPRFYGDSNLRLANGDHRVLPYNLYAGPDDRTLVGPYQLVPRGERSLKAYDTGLVVRGLPRPQRQDRQRDVAGFVFNGGGVRLRDGSLLATLYGHFEGTRRSSLLVADSADGVRWQVRSVVADETCPLPGADGPTEAATCRLEDGRLMCVFRVGAGRPYGQSFSSDEGKTWTAPTNTPADVLSVQPCLLVRGDGAVVLSGGRPGLFLWIDTAGDGRTWQRVEMHRHHDACRPDEPLDRITIDGRSRTTGYTRIAPLADDRLLYVYDRVPNGWSALPQDSTETNSIWAVQVALRRKPRDEAGK